MSETENREVQALVTDGPDTFKNASFEVHLKIHKKISGTN